MLTEEQLKEIEERAARATPGPWTAYYPRCCGDMGWIAGPDRRVCPESSGKFTHAMDYADAEFCAHARDDIPALIAEVRALKRLEEHCCRCHLDLKCNHNVGTP